MISRLALLFVISFCFPSSTAASPRISGAFIQLNASNYSAIAPVMKRHGVEFWSNVEVFDQTAGWPVNDKVWTAQPAAFRRVLEQVKTTNPFTTKTISFEYTQYMDSGSSPQAKALFEAYQLYVITRD